MQGLRPTQRGAGRLDSLRRTPNLAMRSLVARRATPWLLLSAILLCAASPPSRATKPCLPSPCESPTGPDFTKCREAAAWVALGSIDNIVHHEQGPPLLKDFAEFTFVIDAWEKGGEPDIRSIRFQVGWCENSQPLPATTSGKFRFYGLPAPSDPSVPRQYLYFERVTRTQ
jgi:hypothetical protein